MTSAAYDRAQDAWVVRTPRFAWQSLAWWINLCEAIAGLGIIHLGTLCSKGAPV